MSHWATQYIGLKYDLGGRTREGLDCWGLVCLAYQEQLSVELPLLPGIGDTRLINAVNDIWDEGVDWKEVTEPQDLDVVGMGRKSVLHHVGLWTGSDGGKIIHCMGYPVKAETQRQLELQGLRNFRFFRHGIHS